jgi:murein DD-endopeptidase MepM/ murein hydrolase activator NlpD
MEVSGTTPEVLDKSMYSYALPFPKDTKVEKIIKDPEEGTHNGPFKGAIDFIVPLGTDVLAPQDGFVTEVVDKHKKSGSSEKFQKELNYITINHGDEFSQIAHLARGSATVKKGAFVLKGEKVGETGMSGQMSEPHLHFFVYKPADTPNGFVGLEPRFK